MARRFGKFNPRQKRDRKGRWTKGGGSSSSKAKSSKAKSKPRSKPNYKTGQLSDGSILLTKKDPNRYAKRGQVVGLALGIAAGAAVANPLAGGAVGLVGGAFVGNSIDRAVSKRRIRAAEAALRRRK